MRKSLPTTVAVRVREEARYGRLPLLPEERDLGLRRASAAHFTLVLSFWPLLVGTLLPRDVNLFAAFCLLTAGTYTGATLSAIAALPAARYGIDAVDFAKCVFGQRGAKILVLIFFAAATLEIQVLAKLVVDVVRLVPEIYMTPPRATSCLILTAYSTAVCAACARGPLAASRLSYVVLPAVTLIMGLLSMLAYQEWRLGISCGLPSASATTGLSVSTQYYSVGFALALKEWSQTTALARHAATRSAIVVPNFLILAPGLAAVAWMGLLVTRITGFDSVRLWLQMLGHGPFLVVAGIVVVTACMAGASNQITLLTLSLRHFRALRQYSWVQSICVLCFFEQLVAIGLLVRDVSLVLLLRLIEITLGAGLVVLCLNFCFVRQHRLDLASVYDDAPGARYSFVGGFQRLSVACWAILTGLGLVGAYLTATGAFFDRAATTVASLLLLSVSAVYVRVSLQSDDTVREKRERRPWARPPRVINI